MNACILTIGYELLQGFTIDTNANWISKILLSKGIQVKKILTIGDEHNIIKKETCKILDEKFDYVFVTGGLGPTHDDVTKNAFCDIFSDEMYFDENYYSQLKKKFKEFKGDVNNFPKINKSQAMLLKKADSINNLHGSALGLHYVNKNTHIFIMPGVPFEMKAMMNSYIVPKYMKNKLKNDLITINTTGIMESQLAEIIEPLMEKYSSTCDFAFLPSYTGVSFRIYHSNSKDDFNKIINDFYRKMEPYAFGFDNDTLESVLAKKLTKKRLTIATAESCTGGLVGKRLTDIPGSSKYFLGSIVAYDNQLKTDFLGISSDILQSNGAVSENVALKMAESIRTNTQADIGISTTGISGPSGGNESKTLGLVFIGLSMKNISSAKRYVFKVSRHIHREITTTAALNIIRLAIEN